jgi:acyl-homoserine lactone acylase PvdQ
LWDHYGVAHAYAKNMEGLFFGYVCLDAKPWRFDLNLYRESCGRAAEYWGPGAKDENVKQEPLRAREWRPGAW